MRFSAPPWLITGCLLSALFALPFNLIPIVLGSAADHFSLQPQQIGLLGSSLLGGWFLSSVLYFAVNRKVTLRTATIAGIVLSACGYSLSLLANDYSLLSASWVLAGFGAALPFCVAIQMLSEQGDQERNMGSKLATEVFLGAALLYLFPVLLISRWQYQGAALGMAACMLLALVVVRYVPARTSSQGETEESSVINVAGSNAAAWIALISFLVFFGAQTGTWAFLERIGNDINLSAQELGISFAILKVLGGAAGVTAAVLGSRFGIRWPHVVGLVGIGVGLLLLNKATSFIVFALGSWSWEFGFALIQCYQMAAIPRLDKSKRLVALVPAAAGLGAFIGPTVAGYLKTGASYAPMLTFTFVCTVITSAVYLLLLNKKRQADLLDA